MIEPANPGITYGVETQAINGTWHIRYGWFSEDEDGLDRARLNEAHLIEVERYSKKDVRIVKRKIKVEVVK